MPDTDGDGVADPDDNCLVLVNGPGTNHVPNPRNNGSYQCDDDLDGFGNRCDCDFDQNGVCDGEDATLLSAAIGPVDASTAIFDLDCDQTVDTGDLGTLLNLFSGGGVMGVGDLRSGLACADPTTPPPGNCQSPTP